MLKFKEYIKYRNQLLESYRINERSDEDNYSNILNADLSGLGEWTFETISSASNWIGYSVKYWRIKKMLKIEYNAQKRIIDLEKQKITGVLDDDKDDELSEDDKNNKFNLESQIKTKKSELETVQDELDDNSEDLHYNRQDSELLKKDKNLKNQKKKILSDIKNIETQIDKIETNKQNAITKHEKKIEIKGKISELHIKQIDNEIENTKMLYDNLVKETDLFVESNPISKRFVAKTRLTNSISLGKDIISNKLYKDKKEYDNFLEKIKDYEFQLVELDKNLKDIEDKHKDTPIPDEIELNGNKVDIDTVPEKLKPFFKEINKIEIFDESSIKEQKSKLEILLKDDKEIDKEKMLNLFNVYVEKHKEIISDKSKKFFDKIKNSDSINLEIFNKLKKEFNDIIIHEKDEMETNKKFHLLIRSKIKGLNDDSVKILDKVSNDELKENEILKLKTDLEKENKDRKDKDLIMNLFDTIVQHSSSLIPANVLTFFKKIKDKISYTEYKELKNELEKMIVSNKNKVSIGLAFENEIEKKIGNIPDSINTIFKEIENSKKLDSKQIETYKTKFENEIKGLENKDFLTDKFNDLIEKKNIQNPKEIDDFLNEVRKLTEINETDKQNKYDDFENLLKKLKVDNDEYYISQLDDIFSEIIGVAINKNKDDYNGAVVNMQDKIANIKYQIEQLRNTINKNSPESVAFVNTKINPLEQEKQQMDEILKKLLSK